MKICIIGGGTAGWFAANYISSVQPEHEITVVESSKIGIIGAGEGSTGIFATMLHQQLKISFEEFLVGAKATQKLGIRFHNWQGDGRSFIAPLDNTDSAEREFWDLSLMYHVHKHGNKNAYSSTINGTLASQGLSSVHRFNNGVVPRHSYHFDGHHVGKFLKSRLLDQRKDVRVIDSEVIDARLDDRGYVEAVKLKSGQSIRADVWVDASGFARVFAKYVDHGWHSYSQYLSCDRAIPFLLPHKDTVDPLTEAFAMNSGWMWQIPTQERLGCGYVFDSDFISEDQALKEVELKLGHSVDPIKVIKFEPGRYERAIVKNVVSIGLAQSFLEPLQATSIHGTMGILFQMMQFWLRPWGMANDTLTEKINQDINQGIDHFADLIQCHYRSGRSDTEFWRHTQELPERPFLTELKEIAKHRWLNNGDWRQTYGSAGYGVFIYPLLEYGFLKHANDSVFLTVNIEKEYQAEQQAIQNIVNQALPHTELVQRIKNYGSIAVPQIQSQIDQSHLHPLLRF